jgi:hypothetical protein
MYLGIYKYYQDYQIGKKTIKEKYKITLKYMKICPKCKENKELDKFSKSKRRSDSLQLHCKSCHKSYRTINKEKIAHKKALYATKNKEEIAKYMIIYHSINYVKNKKKILDKINNYKKKNKEKVATIKREWRKANPGKYASYCAKRRSARFLASPAWLTKEQIKEIESFYAKASQLTKDIGIQYHVDHICPLQGEHISGLHVPWNLQIITATENMSKSNKLIL